MNQPIVIRDGKIAVYHTPIGAKLTTQAQPVNRSCPLKITFNPPDEGDYLTSLVLVHNASGSPTGVSIRGQAIAPRLCLDTSELNFGDISAYLYPEHCRPKSS